jgi:protein-S-isoprenylcysteine O-methyltransferase Ste14
MESKNDKGRLNKILSSSYIFYFILFFIGILIDLAFPKHVFENTYAMPVGFLFIILSSIFIFWIKLNSKKLKKEILTKEDFMQGPYKYTSIPNHWGIFILILGFGIMVNTVFVVIITTIAFFITLPIFLKMQETVLVEKYGDTYKEYRKIVKF